MKTIFIKNLAFNDIFSHNKNYELRLNKKYFHDLKVGENIIFKDSMRNLKCIIEEIYTFKTLEEVFENLDFRHFNSRTTSKFETIDYYKKLYPKINLSIIVFKIKIVT
jgi:ASC-1-like (ASCH) protein